MTPRPTDPGSPPVLDRRPIPARDLPVSRRIAATLAKAGVSANTISVLSMVFAGIAAIALSLTGRLPAAASVLYLAAAAGIALRLLANMFDGMVAVATGTASRSAISTMKYPIASRMPPF